MYPSGLPTLTAGTTWENSRLQQGRCNTSQYFKSLSNLLQHFRVISVFLICTYKNEIAAF
jgi:hypothetical protein